MRYTPVVLLGTALVCLTAGGHARADHIDWFYAWSNRPSTVYADGSTTSYVTLSDESQTEANDSTDIVATNLNVFSDAPAGAPATFTHKTYTLTLSIWDSSPDGPPQTLVFTGEFNGQVTDHSSNLANSFTGQSTQSLTIGQHLYTVTMDAYAPPGPQGSSNAGAIGAQAVVTVQTLPEPASVVLAALALPALGLVGRRKRRSSRQFR